MSNLLLYNAVFTQVRIVTEYYLSVQLLGIGYILLSQPFITCMFVERVEQGIYWARRNFELLVWVGALIGLYFMPAQAEHFSLCPLGAIGITWCPGCGVGHAIHHTLHLEFTEAFQHHFTGVFALIVILYRIFQLTKLNHKYKKLDYHGRQNV